MWEAIYLPNGNLSKGGFETEELAWDWINENSCVSCRKEGAINHCSGEWCVDKEGWGEEE